jgi:predicted PolB exonuclease-like 3'-5' exonuclease
MEYNLFMVITLIDNKGDEVIQNIKDIIERYKPTTIKCNKGMYDTIYYALSSEPDMSGKHFYIRLFKICEGRISVIYSEEVQENQIVLSFQN